MGFKSKLYLAFGSIVAILVMFLGIAMFLIYQLDTNVNEVMRNRYEKVRLTTGILQEVRLIESELKTLIMAAEYSQTELALQRIAEHQEELQAAYETYIKLANNSQVAGLLPRLKATQDNYRQLTMDIIILTKSGRQVEAASLLAFDGQRIIGQAIGVAKEIQITEEGSLAKLLEQSAFTSNLAQILLAVCIITCLLAGGTIAIQVVGSITYDLRRLAKVISSVQAADSESFPRIAVSTRDEIGCIAVAFNEMAAALERHRKQEKEFIQAMEQQNWLKSQLAEMSTMLQGVNDRTTLGRAFISKLAPTVGASYGVFYLVESENDNQVLSKIASYADTGDSLGLDKIRMGEGITGQCALQNQPVILEQVPNEYIKIASGLGSSKPDYVAVFPSAVEDKVLAVVELAGFGRLTETHTEYLKQVMNNVAISFMRVISKGQTDQLLAESQAFAEELQHRSAELQQQQEELRIINERLEEQYKHSEEKTRALEHAKAVLEAQAQQLDVTAKYKSEFLANMSHELRTPLNSLLLLAQMLSANQEGNLTSKQLEYAHAIHSAGNDLLLLINDILDLAKLKSGKLSINPEPVSIANFTANLVKQFKPVAENAGLAFNFDIAQDVPATIYTDSLRLQQIMKNLLSNAFKFTEKGWVNFQIKRALNREWLMFVVSDSGIGISAEKQAVIFEAFRQADGTTSRKYGGTGLGLSISRELSLLLGGYINLDSREGYGSTFALYLPIEGSVIIDAVESVKAQAAAGKPEQTVLTLQGGSDLLSPQSVNGSETAFCGMKVLIVDNDMRNVYALVAAMEARGIAALFAQNSREGLECLKANPDIKLVIMDTMMPDTNGIEAIQAIRELPDLQALPIIVLTAKTAQQDKDSYPDDEALDYISKPVQLDTLFSLMRLRLQP